MASVAWSDYTTQELKAMIERSDPIVIVPVGATEQHGPHLPVNTDADLGAQIATRIAKASPVPALTLPAIWAGFSPHHMAFCGTITLKQETLFAVVYDVLESLVAHGVSRILLLNSHGGNIALLKTVVDEVGIRLGVSPVYATYWHLISDLVPTLRRSELGGMSHAGELETALKMVFAPDDVRSDAIEDVMIRGNEFHGVDMFAANRIGIYRPFDTWSETGQIGAPSLATPETGERLLEAIVEQFVRLIQSQWGGQ